VEGSAVQLNDQALLPPDAVRLDEAATDGDRRVHLGSWKAAGIDEPEEALLQFAPGAGRADAAEVKDRPDRRRTAPPRVPRKQFGQREGVGVASALRLVDGPFDAPAVQDRREVEQGAWNDRHGD
jgi:hypothetical protein